jgi:hypothetical protein
VNDIPLLIDFATPSSIFREPNRISTLRIIGNGPPGTFVLFPNGLRVSLPTDQIVFADDTGGHARVGFGGMKFVGSEDGHLVFVRSRELLLEDQLSPARSHTMLLDPQRVATVSIEGRSVWPVVRGHSEVTRHAGPQLFGERLIKEQPDDLRSRCAQSAPLAFGRVGKTCPDVLARELREIPMKNLVLRHASE